jgi:P-type conjugative transfer protein TrbL
MNNPGLLDARRFRFYGYPILGVLAVFAIFVLPSIAFGQLWFDDMVDTYKEASGFGTGTNWEGRAKQVALSLFGVFVVIEVVVSGLVWAHKKESPDAILRELVAKFVLFGVCFVILSNHNMVLRPLVQGLNEAGHFVVGSNQVYSPGQLMGFGFRQGYHLASTVPVTLARAMPPADGDCTGWACWIPGSDTIANIWNFLNRLSAAIDLLLLNSVPFFLCVVGGVIVFLSFAIIAFQLARALIEMYIALSAGVVFLGFSSFRVTAGLSESYLRYVFETGVRLFFIQVMIGVGIAMIAQWETQIVDATGNWGAIGEAPEDRFWGHIPRLDVFRIIAVVTGVVAYAYFAWLIPNKFASVITRDVQFGLSNALRN